MSKGGNVFNSLEEAVIAYGNQISRLAERDGHKEVSAGIVGWGLLDMAKRYHEDAPAKRGVDAEDVAAAVDALRSILREGANTPMRYEFSMTKRMAVANVADRLEELASALAVPPMETQAVVEDAPAKPKKTMRYSTVVRRDVPDFVSDVNVYNCDDRGDSDILDSILKMANKRYERKWRKLPDRPGLVFGSHCDFYAVDNNGDIVGSPMIEITHEETEL